MDETAMLLDAAGRLFAGRFNEDARRRARIAGWDASGWQAVEEMGLPLALVPEDRGGFGVAAADALSLLRLAGRHGVGLPIAETMIANGALAAAGLPSATGPAGLIPGPLPARRDGGAWRIEAVAPRIAAGRHATHLVAELVVEGQPMIARIDQGWSVAEHHENLAGEARDDLAIATTVVAVPFDGAALQDRGAAARTLQIAGALEVILELTIAHVTDRVQFGKALGKFQAVQHALAQAAGETAASGAAAGIVTEALTRDRAAARLAIAAARIRCGEAAGIATAIAHQLHGAIGFTAEHPLHLLTTSLWSWRDEYGGQRYWATMLGKAALDAGVSDFWPWLAEAA